MSGSVKVVSDGLNVDLDAADNVVGFDIDHASRRRPVYLRDQGATRAFYQGWLFHGSVNQEAAV